ncbi:4-carboxymuconolactone decarboxylase [Nocardia sp. NPDC004860]|uniref:bifunctional 3-oxoadipate enol-lactonase/4-carboxymuconolactone decarboxylase PcaDC n=1 Tax=Nocardia sp. NPDC004860 TaxID=3154557 RepID=UPI0033AD419D
MSVTAVRLAGHPGLPLLVTGPSLGTSSTALWSATATELGRDFHVVGWDLPGHGHNTHLPEKPITIADLARDMLEALREIDGTGAIPTFHYAGDSVGGAVGLQLLLDHPDRITSATLLCTGARIGNPEDWRERQRTVRTTGTTAMVAVSAQRWFGPGFVEREPERASALLHALAETDDTGYVAVCGALADFDVRDRLGEITVPVLAVAGADDGPTPPDSLDVIARGVQHGRLVVLPGVAHLAPAEAPREVAKLISEHARAASRDERTLADLRAAGTTVRREVLGDRHVDRATAAATDLTREFQQFITEYAWGGIWTRPGLDRRARSLITLTALIARGHHEEFAMHVRAARTNGLTVSEIKELIMQSAIYCGVPDANTAFRIAQATLADLGEA